MRGFATYVMVIYHFVSWYLPQLPQYDLMRFIVITVFGLPLRFCFITIPSMGVILQLHISRKKGINEKILKKSIIKRGLLLILIQFFCNFMGLTPVYIWNSFILSFIGISIIVSYYASKCSQKMRILLIIVVVFFTPFLKYQFFYIYLKAGFTLTTWTIDTFLYSMFLQVDFPIFPYIAYSLFGTIYTEKMIEAIENGKQGKFVRNSLILGALLLIIYMIFMNFGYLVNFPDFFLNRPTRQDFFFCCGSVMLLIGLFFGIQDWRKIEHSIFKPIELYGFISLTVYITHYYFFQKAFDLIYDPWQNLNPYSVLQLSLIVWLVYIFYGLMILRNNRKYSIEWFIRKCV